ncbi:efflux RND transporter periplasmic adaptor subunit [Amorphus coralli]|uniref:efflux RND transporter periplasmic adaptor subunit n=1 Tax=Amorphus coralli TaxID=340680 RepID=UPI00037B0E26|nr:HlyD family efflux transporter periplasmic adaptor subunit [Amorphus coralli]
MRSALGLTARAVLPVLVLVGAVAFTQWLVGSKPEMQRRPPTETAYSVETVEPERGAHSPTVSVYGEVVSAARVELRALVDGEIMEVAPGLKAGATVAAGDDLLAIDAFSYEGALVEAKANLAEAEAELTAARSRVALKTESLAEVRTQLDLAERDLERGRTLVTRQAGTEQSVDERSLVVSQRRQSISQLVNEIAIEEAGIKQQTAAIERLRWRVRNAERDLADTALKAPFDAVVVNETVEVGRLIGENDVAVTLDRLDAVDVEFTLSDRQYGVLVNDGGSLEGTPIEVIWRIGDTPRRYTATVERVGAEISSARGGIQVYARLDESQEKALPRPGAFVEVRLPGRVFADSIRIAAASVYDRDHVFVVRDSRLERRTVAVLAQDGDTVIVAGEVAPGDHVLLTRIAEAGDGLLVNETLTPPAAEPATAVRAAGTVQR